MSWSYQIWCDDCLGEDYQGCFDGLVETSEDSFATEAEAEAAAEKHVGQQGLWEYQVFENLG